MNKPEMRRAMQAFLAGIPAGDLEERSSTVCRRLQESAAWRWMDTLLAFLSMPHEIDTADVIRSAGGEGRPVGVPRIEGQDIRFLAVPPGGPTPPRDRWGIPVPDPSWPALDPARAGNVLVCAPGLAFDRQGNRLGRGRGYYDRFLGRARADGARLLVIGVCFSEQLVDEVPHGAADQALDGVVTDKETLFFDHTGLIQWPGTTTLTRMGVIKSAYEIAMENSKGIEANKEIVEQSRLRDEGKKLASKFLDDPAFELKGALKGYDAAQGKLVKEGLLQSLLANLVLPIDEFAMKDTKKLGEAVAATVTDTKKLTMIFGQLDGFFKEYVGERKRLVETVERQYAPKLKKKEEDLSRQMGRQVRINPAADPEFQSIIRQYLSQLDAKYGESLDAAKEEIKAAFAKSP